MDQVLLLAVLIFLAFALAIFGVFSAASRRRDRRKIVDRIRGSRSEASRAAGERAALGGAFARHFSSFAAAVGKGIAADKSGIQASPQRQLFLQAGFRWEHAMAAFFGFKIFGAVLLAAGGALWRVLASFTGKPLVAVPVIAGLGLLGWYLPDIVLRLRIAHRKELLLQGFPDALDLMVVCVESGMGLDAAVNRVGEEMRLSNPAISEEFRLLSLELRAGKMRSDALRAMAIRSGLEEIRSFANLLIQTDRFGTSVAQALRVHADSVRVRRALRAEELAAKIPVKLVLPLVVFIFPSIFVVVVGPAAIRIFRSLVSMGQ